MGVLGIGRDFSLVSLAGYTLPFRLESTAHMILVEVIPTLLFLSASRSFVRRVPRDELCPVYTRMSSVAASAPLQEERFNTEPSSLPLPRARPLSRSRIRQHATPLLTAFGVVPFIAT